MLYMLYILVILVQLCDLVLFMFKDKAVKTWGSPGVNLVTGLYRLIKWFGKKENHENKKTDNIVCKASSFVGNSFLFRL